MSGVASRNPFALLGDDADVAAATAPAPKAPVAAAPPKPTPAPAATRTNNNGPRGGRGSSGFRGPPRNAAPRGDGAEQPAGEQRDARGAGRGRDGSGEGRGRGGRGRGGRGRGREFDRHSQTGKEDTDKSIAQGWGGQDGKRELEAEESGKADAAGETAAGDVTPVANGASERPAPIPEEEDNTKTLDEFLAEQTAKRANLGVAAGRTATDSSAWDKLQATKVEHGKTEEEYYAAKEKASRGPRQRKEKQTIEIDARFESPAGSRGGGRGGNRGGDRGGRGGGRGGPRGGPRGGARGGRGSSTAGAGSSVNLADQSAFPSLG